MGVHVRPASLQDGVAVLALLEDVGYYPEPVSYAQTFRKTIHDPHFQEYDLDLHEAVTGSDCVILMVAHDEYRGLDLEDLRAWVSTPVLIDGRNLYEKTRAEELGFIYAGVGNR